MLEKNYRDLKNTLDTYLADGLAEGLEKGKANKAKEIALNLLKKGLDDAFVQETTGLSLPEIANIRQENNL